MGSIETPKCRNAKTSKYLYCLFRLHVAARVVIPYHTGVSNSPGQPDALAGMHVVIVPAWWPSPEQPIAGIFFEDYARAFASAGAKVGVVYPDLVSVRYLGRGRSIPLRPRIRHERIDAIPVVRIRGLHTAFGRPGLQMRRYLAWLRRGLSVYCESHGVPDVLHAMCAIPAGWACMQLDSDRVRRVVVTEHTGPFSLALTPPSAAKYVHDALDSAAAVVAVSDHLKRQMLAAGVTREIEVISNPVGPQFVASEPPSVSPPSGDSRPSYRAVLVGRLTEEKGVRELLTAADALGHDKNFAIEWHIVGDGPMKKSIRARAAIKTDSPSPPIVLHGLCDKDRVARIITGSHFLVLPSYGENCPLAICEALSIGRPVIGTRGTGCEELIDNENGELCDVGSAESLVGAVRRLIARYNNLDSQAIADCGGRRFSAAAVAAQYAGVYRRI